VTLVSPEVTANLAEIAGAGEITWERREYQSSDLLRGLLPTPGGQAHQARSQDKGRRSGSSAVAGPSPVAEPSDSMDRGSVEGLDPSVMATSVGHETSSSSSFWLVHTATGTTADAVVAQDSEKVAVWCIRADSGTDSAAILGAQSKGPDGIQVSVASGDPGRSRGIAQAVTKSLSTGALPVRRSRHESPVGWVGLVGGGPGELGLLTLRGRQLLALADVVVTDRLGPISVLGELDDDVRIVDVGKSPGYHPVPQDEINEILVVEAKAGLRVVRLKGGDPFVLGRGAEEAQFCQEHDVPVEWVPGVTSAVSVPAAAGIPVTHRSTSPAFIVASGHESSEAAAATPPETTVLLLMAVLHLAETAQLLMGRGRATDTPVVIIEKGWTPSQRVTRTNLGECGEVVTEQGIRPPAVVVVGPAAALADVLGSVSAVVPR
jgi:uroporphyrin-III C-methyltransferase/precorrin-2 dehydrogenase/sirohydrochlorin ferrochelatase